MTVPCLQRLNNSCCLPQSPWGGAATPVSCVVVVCLGNLCVEITAQAACERDFCSRALTKLQTLLYTRCLTVRVQWGRAISCSCIGPGRTIPKSWTFTCPFRLHVAYCCILKVLLCPVPQSSMSPALLSLPHSQLLQHTRLWCHCCEGRQGKGLKMRTTTQMPQQSQLI